MVYLLNFARVSFMIWEIFLGNFSVGYIQQDHAIASHNMGTLFFNGEFVEEDHEVAYKYFATAAELGTAGLWPRSSCPD